MFVTMKFHYSGVQFHLHYGFWKCQILVLEINLKSSKNRVASFCCEALNSRH